MKGGASFNTKGFDRVISMRKKALAGIRLTVGIHRGKQNNGTDVAAYAAHNNFGTKNAMGWVLIPARPFMTYSADRIADFVESARFRRLIIRVMRGEISSSQAVKILGEHSKNITRKTIRESALYKPNADITKARKKSSKPLIHSGVMVQTVDWKQA